MGTPDYVEGVQDPYDSQVKCWNEDSSTYKQDDEVPPVGIAETYAIFLNAPGHPPRFVWVHELKITAAMAHQPIEKSPVFSKWGEYLGTGGEELEDPGKGPVAEAATSMIEMLEKMNAPKKVHQRVCPRCKEKVFDDTDLFSDVQDCCNPECDGEWKTGCYHCHDSSLINKVDEQRTEVIRQKTHPVVKTFEHEFQLRRDWKVTLELPVGLTEKEAERLSEWVRVLSLQGS